MGAITGISVGFGPVVGGAIVQGLAWQRVLWLNVPAGLAFQPFDDRFDGAPGHLFRVLGDGGEVGVAEAGRPRRRSR